jgi:hypothetical protein
MPAALAAGNYYQRKRGTPKLRKHRWPAKFVSHAQCNGRACGFYGTEMEVIENEININLNLMKLIPLHGNACAP